MQALSVVEQALVITVIGVVLIFVVLFVLWGLMAGLVRATTPPTASESKPAFGGSGDNAQNLAASVADEAAQRAAAVAVAVAVALAAHEDKPPQTQRTQGPISPWQATIRGNAMSRRAGVFRRNPPQR